MPHVVEGRYVAGYTIWLRFSDGAEGEVDLTEELRGPIFEPLRNPELFRQFVVHPELRTLVWPQWRGFRTRVPPRLSARRRLRKLCKSPCNSALRIYSEGIELRGT